MPSNTWKWFAHSCRYLLSQSSEWQWLAFWRNDKEEHDCKSCVTPNSSSNFSPQTLSSRYENRPTESVKQQSRRDSRNKKDRGEQWRKSLGDGTVTNNRQPSTNDPLSPNVTSRFSPYRRESPSSYRHQSSLLEVHSQSFRLCTKKYKLLLCHL